ncbi:hypothetical protein CN689_06245 [Peribacillus butanolivorans]|uniref:RNA polymerase sigma-70 region 2 domain-containing protein n=1 Tax=Peribacillus butanolivorans TaxID=421767 RepID=A0AAX0S6C8_9BACI|nr:hypothetical protein CN689_06245 [Peribacillus butanolivorans]
MFCKYDFLWDMGRAELVAWPHLLPIYRWRTKREWNHTYEKSMMRFLVYYIGKQDVEDLAQETFVWAFVKYRGRHQLEHRRQPLGCF